MKYLKPVVLCIVMGFLMGIFLYGGYENSQKIIPAFEERETLKFIKLGEYDSEQAMETNVSKLSNYIYLVKDNKYSVYIGITKKDDISKKIQDYYQTLGYVTSKEEFSISNKKFLETLKTYDEMLSKTNDKSVTENIINGVLTKYEELVSNG